MGCVGITYMTVSEGLLIVLEMKSAKSKGQRFLCKCHCWSLPPPDLSASLCFFAFHSSVLCFFQTARLVCSFLRNDIHLGREFPNESGLPESYIYFQSLKSYISPQNVSPLFFFNILCVNDLFFFFFFFFDGWLFHFLLIILCLTELPFIVEIYLGKNHYTIFSNHIFKDFFYGKTDSTIVNSS